MSKNFQNRMKQREFYLVYGYPSEWVHRRAARSLLRRAYVGVASGVSSARCRHHYWGMPLDWWLLRGVAGPFQRAEAVPFQLVDDYFPR